MWLIRHSIDDWVCFKTHILLETLKIQNQVRAEFLCVIGSRTSVRMGWRSIGMRKVSTSSKMRVKLRFVAEARVMLAPSSKKLDEREFVVDSEALVHTLNKKDLISAELEKPIEFSKTPMRLAKIRWKKGFSQGIIQKSEPQERTPWASRFEERTQDETLKQERCARRDARELAKDVHKLKQEGKTHSTLLPKHE